MPTARRAPAADTDPAATRAALIARARDLLPAVRARADAARAERRVPEDSIADFRAAGLTRMTQPRRYGGDEAGWDVLCEVAQTLAAADGAQAWVQAITADHAQMLGTFPAAAQDDVWGENPAAAMSASFEPAGVAVPDGDGWRLSGRWGFSSGIDHADWLICGGFVVDGETRDGPHFFLIRRTDATLIDDWHTVGLEGTGSKSFEARDVAVPAHRFLEGALAQQGRGPGTAVNAAAVYRIPRGGLTPSLFAALAIGMAEGLLAEWLTYTAGRSSRGTAMGGEAASHMVAGQCAAEIAAAGALNLQTVRGGMAILETGRAMTAPEVLAARRDSAFACQLALKAGTRLFNAAGGRAVYRASRLAGMHGDILAAAAHHIVNWEPSAIASGRDLIERGGAAGA